MGRAKWWVIAMFVLCTSVSLAATALNLVQLQDVKSNGTRINAFHAPVPYFWNFVRGTTFTTATRTLNIGVQSAIQDPDLGLVESPNGVQIGTNAARPTCNAAQRGTFWSSQTQDGGDDKTYQCCRISNNDAGTSSFTWTAGYCS